MVFYECVVTTKNTARTWHRLSFVVRFLPFLQFIVVICLDFHTLTNLVKLVSHEIVEGGGIVRAVQNHGIRTLPHRFKATYPDREGNRYYAKGRFFSIYYDANPDTMSQVDTILKMDEEVLRSTHLRARSTLDFINLREDRNPYIQQILHDEEQAAVQESNKRSSD
jgi:ribosomal protein S6